MIKETTAQGDSDSIFKGFQEQAEGTCSHFPERPDLILLLTLF